MRYLPYLYYYDLGKVYVASKCELVCELVLTFTLTSNDKRVTI